MTPRDKASARRAAHEAWLALRCEDVLETEQVIIDPHHHVVDHGDDVYPVASTLRDVSSGHAIVATVHVECRNAYFTHGPEPLRCVGETTFLAAERRSLEAARERRVLNSFVGAADLTLGDGVEAVLEAQVRAGEGRLSGIRMATAHEPSGVLHSYYLTRAGMMAETRFREGFARLRRHGLVFDAWLYHTQLAELAALADAFAQTTIVVGHCGAPLGIGPYEGKRDEVFALWKAGVAALALRPNVLMKIGGLGMPLAGFRFNRLSEPPSSAVLAEAWRPYVETCIAAFGAERCMFESNYPIDRQSATYRTLWNAFKRLAAGASASEKDALFRAVAARAYGLEAGVSRR
jgi:L-fuconolactonase